MLDNFLTKQTGRIRAPLIALALWAVSAPRSVFTIACDAFVASVSSIGLKL